MASISRCVALACALLAAACASTPDASECATGITCPEGTKCAAVQPVCITNNCGDGIVQATEICDDGNIVDGDGCAANCLSREVCGDIVLNSAAGELCDDGNAIGGDGCAADCRSVEICGNVVRDVNEACDDGNTLPGDGCSGNCKSTEVCGNGIVDINEKCDDAGAAGGCNDDCQGGTGCGDGAIDKDGSGNPLEECDDGNSDNQDDCSNACSLNTCGDGVIQTSGVRVEACDPAVGFGETDTCNIDCTAASCGDGKINNAAGEQCDEGAGMNGDDRDCTAMCQVNVCGDGHENALGPLHIEACDDGNDVQTDGCSNQCTEPECGNGVLDTLEACDDGNPHDGDGCSSACKFETCGDGIENNGEDCDPGPMIETADCNADCTDYACGDLRVNHAAGEECDDMNMVDDDACRNSCRLNVCGDGVKSPTEACDDGDLDNSDGCTTSCTTPDCGNGIVDGADPVNSIPAEECDDGNTNDDDGCLTSCLYNTCGDGFLSPSEQCDEGANNGWTKNCLPTCETNICGDGHRDMEGNGAPETEACDDGNDADEDKCPYGIESCTLCAMGCDAVEDLSGNVCGDGSLDPDGNETCDDQNRVTEASCPYGEATCMGDYCSGDCQTALDSLTGAYCGDGATQSPFGEACDDRNSSACGTCDAACNVQSSAAAATGYILVPPGASLKDNETFTISDGFGKTVVFELDKNASGPTDTNMTNLTITFDGTETATQMRTALRTKIDNVTNFRIDASDGNSSFLLLANTRNGADGNQAIDDTVDSSDFVVFGMTGGAARDCLAGVSCRFNDDCRSGNCNGSNVCTCASDSDCASGTCLLGSCQ